MSLKFKVVHKILNSSNLEYSDQKPPPQKSPSSSTLSLLSPFFAINNRKRRLSILFATLSFLLLFHYFVLWSLLPTPPSSVHHLPSDHISSQVDQRSLLWLHAPDSNQTVICNTTFDGVDCNGTSYIPEVQEVAGWERTVDVLSCIGLVLFAGFSHLLSLFAP